VAGGGRTINPRKGTGKLRCLFFESDLGELRSAGEVADHDPRVPFAEQGGSINRLRDRLRDSVI